jgi:hypothetical protein
VEKVELALYLKGELAIEENAEEKEDAYEVAPLQERNSPNSSIVLSNVSRPVSKSRV